MKLLVLTVKRCRFLFGFLPFFVPLAAQTGIGEWRTHLPYQFTELVMVAQEKAFCSSTGGLFYYDLQDNTVQTISKTDGLSDNGVNAMAWSEENQLALIAYENANVDILKGNEIINVKDILKKQIPGDKSIYNIYFLGNKAYLSCGFGIVVLNLERYEITETYYIGANGDQLKINQVTSDGNYFYAATDEGIRRALISNPFLMDFNSWETINDLPDPGGRYKGIEYFGGKIFAVYHDQGTSRDRVYLFDSSWSIFSAYTDSSCNEIRKSGGYLLFSGEEGVQILSDAMIFVNNYVDGRPRSASYDENGILWVADFGRGLIRIEGSEEKIIKPNGPFSTIAFDMAASQGYLYTASGGVTANFNNIFRSAILQVFRDQAWVSNITDTYRDLISLVIDPNDFLHVYAASWGYGLVEYYENRPVNVFNEANSSLQNAVPGANVIRVGGLAYDTDGNLWMTNSAVPEPISVMKADGSWKSFRADGILSSFNALGEILISEEGNLWGIVPKGGGLFAINFNGTLDNEEDDEYRLVNVVDENDRVITNEVYAFAEDLNGNIWLGTNQGILVIYSPDRLFTEGSVYAQEIIVPRNDGTNFGDPLLQTEKVTTIEVDGSNRKWIGTADGGAFLVSENGFEQIHNFNTGNSPMLSNSITDICVDGKSGEVFFGTDKGIVSFRGDATKGADSYSRVKVFPNPVRETYDGPIAITGLLAETVVKITDISGNLVNEIQSFGGQAIWDGTNFRGDRVATGTYLIFLVNRGLTAAHVTKVLVIH